MITKDEQLGLQHISAHAASQIQDVSQKFQFRKGSTEKKNPMRVATMSRQTNRAYLNLCRGKRLKKESGHKWVKLLNIDGSYKIIIKNTVEEESLSDWYTVNSYLNKLIIYSRFNNQQKNTLNYQNCTKVFIQKIALPIHSKFHCVFPNCTAIFKIPLQYSNLRCCIQNCIVLF